jgi:hypothetical protein
VIAADVHACCPGLNSNHVLLCAAIFREMAMLAEVDQPGSAIDQYVDTLEAMLGQKAESIRILQGRLERFKGKLRQEEVMSTTVQKRFSSVRRT